MGRAFPPFASAVTHDIQKGTMASPSTSLTGIDALLPLMRDPAAERERQSNVSAACIERLHDAHVFRAFLEA